MIKRFVGFPSLFLYLIFGLSNFPPDVPNIVYSVGWVIVMLSFVLIFYRHNWLKLTIAILAFFHATTAMVAILLDSFDINFIQYVGAGLVITMLMMFSFINSKMVTNELRSSS